MGILENEDLKDGNLKSKASRDLENEGFRVSNSSPRPVGIIFEHLNY
jgi:hypothetical protein